MQPHFRQKLLNVSDIWLCFARSIILADKQNNWVKDVPGSQIVVSVTITIAAVEYLFPAPQGKKNSCKQTWPRKKFLRRQWTRRKIHAWKLKKFNTPSPPPIT